MSSRSLYPTLLSLTLVALGLLAYQPKLLCGLLQLSQQARAQAPDQSGAVPNRPLPDAQNFLPQPPTQPKPFNYPTTQASAQQVINPVTPPPAGAPPAKAMNSAQVVVRCGPDVVLACDSMAYKQYQMAVEAGASKAQLEEIRKEAAAELKAMADNKLLFQEASKTIPADPFKDIRAKILEKYDTDIVKDRMEKAKVSTVKELDQKLRQFGTSVERQREAFFEISVARMWLSQNVKSKPIEFPQIFAYYNDNPTKFDHPAKARWEQIMVNVKKFNSKQEAYDAICRMGNDVLRGKSFADVATAGSDGPTANKGGARDWTTQGVLKSEVLDRAIFSLPVGRMSQVIEDDDAYHIIRVVERVDAGHTPFSEAQADIRKLLTEEGSKKENEEYLSKLRQKTPVWTIFDELDAKKPAPSTASTDVFNGAGFPK